MVVLNHRLPAALGWGDEIELGEQPARPRRPAVEVDPAVASLELRGRRTFLIRQLGARAWAARAWTGLRDWAKWPQSVLSPPRVIVWVEASAHEYVPRVIVCCEELGHHERIGRLPNEEGGPPAK